jgi:hypothetical protein
MVATDVASRGIGMIAQLPPTSLVPACISLHSLPLTSCALMRPLSSFVMYAFRMTVQALCWLVLTRETLDFPKLQLAQAPHLPA